MYYIRNYMDFPTNIPAASYRSVIYILLISEPYISSCRVSKYIAYLGKISYSTYLLHTIILNLFIPIFNISSNSFSYLIALPIISFTVFIASILSYKFVESSQIILNDRKEDTYEVYLKSDLMKIHIIT